MADGALRLSILPWIQGWMASAEMGQTTQGSNGVQRRSEDDAASQILSTKLVRFEESLDATQV